MRVRLTEIRLRPTGKKVRLDRDLELESLFIGRGPDNDLSLKGLTISLHQATIRMSEGRVYVEAAPGQEVNVNGLVTQGERLGVGDRLRIGPWEIRVLPPESGSDLTLEYEEIDRGGNERAALDARTRIGIESGLFAMRPLAWIGIATILVLFLLLPLVWSGSQSPWNTGDVSRGHATIENDCGSCHSGLFRPVRNQDCMGCHHDTGRHAPVEIEMAELDEASCATCHLEHRGREVNLADLGSDFCSDCHRDLSTRLPGTELVDASDFGDDHPPLRFSLVTDPTTEPVSVDVDAGLVENSGLAFSHLRHVGKAVSGRGDAKQYLQCGACHQPDAGGLYMKPIVFEEHCEDCHRLDFDPSVPAGFTPHGDPAELRTRIRGLYSSRVLEGKVRDASAPRRLRLRRPGAEMSVEEASLSRQWVESKLAAAERRFYDRPGTCALCHGLEEGAASDGGMGIAPVRLQTVWIPGSVFSHGAHDTFACLKCHPAAAVFDPDPDADLPRPSWSAEDAIPYALVARAAETVVSEASGDVLIPTMETCRDCHAGANAWGGDLVPSPCSMCHPFHVRALGPMAGAADDVDAASDASASGDPSRSDDYVPLGDEIDESESEEAEDTGGSDAAGRIGHPLPPDHPRLSLRSLRKSLPQFPAGHVESPTTHEGSVRVRPVDQSVALASDLGLAFALGAGSADARGLGGAR